MSKPSLSSSAAASAFAAGSSPAIGGADAAPWRRLPRISLDGLSSRNTEPLPAPAPAARVRTPPATKPS
ncbi:hypothetical protein [Streptomyces sp. NPDC050560]|uniref:hypothetical protein n=1 Tax=Streptomyces sp. NPDC050560 TaxID=3365630 RepID=UPI0037AF39F8